VSIFNRLISTLTGGEQTTAPAKTPSSRAEGEGKRQRFMGREGGVSTSTPAVVEKGLEGPAMIWLHVQPATQRLLLVPDLGADAGQELTARMQADLRRAGICEQVAYHAGYDQYWKMPTHDAILRTPSLYEIPTLPLNRLKVETRLVKQGEARGCWMHVRIRDAQELEAAEDTEV